MYAVIFEPESRIFDTEYHATAERMRSIAMAEYGCIEFTALSEGSQELTISYWPDLASIDKWKADPRHIEAQKLGRMRWYSSYRVQVVEVLRDYIG